jgi:hypothetical protein
VRGVSGCVEWVYCGIVVGSMDDDWMLGKMRMGADGAAMITQRGEGGDVDGAKEVGKDLSGDTSFGAGNERRPPSVELVSCESRCASPCPCRVSVGWWWWYCEA